jgi:hypothetical protein
MMTIDVDDYLRQVQPKLFKVKAEPVLIDVMEPTLLAFI